MPDVYQLATFNAKERTKKLMRLDINPLDIRSRICDERPDVEKKATELCYILPLMAACSVVAMNKGMAFEEAYIIPQMLMAWIKTCTDYVGVRYRSDADNVFVQDYGGYNIAIAAMIRRIAGSANTLHFIVTADHGFLYKRHTLAESDKIPNTAPKTAFVNRRFIVDADPIAQPGVASLPMATVLNTKTNTLTVSYPTAANVFKVAGGGENYVHGGSSPQEMIVPVLDVRMEKGRMETTTVQLTLVSILKKITNLITALDFMQNEPISDTVRETTFRVYFVGEDNERISNENIVVADKRGETAAERMFRLRFSFKNRKYDNKKPYYLVAYDDKNSVEVLRRQVVMDIAMADDFGFGF